jgi:hypothetical protein
MEIEGGLRAKAVELGRLVGPGMRPGKLGQITAEIPHDKADKAAALVSAINGPHAVHLGFYHDPNFKRLTITANTETGHHLLRQVRASAKT